MALGGGGSVGWLYRTWGAYVSVVQAPDSDRDSGVNAP